MRQDTAKVAQLASKGPKWARLGPFLAALEAPLVTWSIPLRTFMHFCQASVNIYAFLLHITGEFSSIQKK